jgi:hypothetical protein
LTEYWQEFPRQHSRQLRPKPEPRFRRGFDSEQRGVCG